jgi:hypothetical protein
VVVTGASAGIGRAAAELFGARVALIARGEDGLRGAADAVDYQGGTALPVPVDVADFEAVDRAAERAEIYRPEVAAEGVVFAADHPERKEYWLGGSTVATILAQKLAPPLLDRYLARTGYDSQQTGRRTAQSDNSKKH